MIIYLENAENSYIYVVTFASKVVPKVFYILVYIGISMTSHNHTYIDRQWDIQILFCHFPEIQYMRVLYAFPILRNNISVPQNSESEKQIRHKKIKIK